MEACSQPRSCMLANVTADFDNSADLIAATATETTT